MSALRRKKKLTQKDIPLAQKVISRIENHETDPRLSTVVTYLNALGYDINDLFKEESIMKRPTVMMVEHLNLKLKEDGSCLRYLEKVRDANLITYELCIDDKYIDSRINQTVNMSVEFATLVREFFSQYGVENTGFINTIATLLVEC